MARAEAACSSSLCRGSSRPFVLSNQFFIPFSVPASVSHFPKVTPNAGLWNRHICHSASRDRRVLPSHSKLLGHKDEKKLWLDFFCELLTDTGAGVWILHDHKRESLSTDLKHLCLDLNNFEHRTCKIKESLKEEVWLGYWVGPDDMDGWGFVEAFLAPL